MRYFIVVAEELHFSRAAARLFLAQQALSRQVRELEDELGVQLFIRSTRKVALTAAGEVFLAGARAALDALDRAAAMALRANRAVTGALRLGYYPGAALELTEPIVTEFRSRYPDVTLEMHESPTTDPSCGLADGSSDIALVRLPQNTDGMTTEVLFAEPLVVAVSTGHRLAARLSVAAHELLDEPITISPTSDPTYRDFFLLNSFRDGKTPPSIIVTRSVTEEVQLIATGSAIAITVSAAARFVSNPSVRFIPITDAAKSAVALGWRVEDSSTLIQRFRECAVAVRDREADLVQLIENPLSPL